MTFAQYQSRHLRRKRNEQMLLLGAFGMLCALFVVALVMINGRSGDAVATESLQSPVQELGSMSLLAPAQDVAAGTKLSEVTFREVFWPKGQVPANAVTNAALHDIRNLYAKVSMPAQLPITRDMLSEEGATSTLPLEKGFRAVTIPVDATSGIEGWALPGVIVDVMLTYSQDGQLSTQVIVENAKVLSQNGRSKQPTLNQFDPLAGSAASITTAGSTITLQVRPTDALKIQTARQMGTLGLTMRADGDYNGNPLTMITGEQIRSNSSVPTKVARKPGCGGKSGMVRYGDTEYTVDCEGQISQIMDSYEP